MGRWQNLPSTVTEICVRIRDWSRSSELPASILLIKLSIFSFCKQRSTSTDTKSQLPKEIIAWNKSKLQNKTHFSFEQWLKVISNSVRMELTIPYPEQQTSAKHWQLTILQTTALLWGWGNCVGRERGWFAVNFTEDFSIQSDKWFPKDFSEVPGTPRRGNISQPRCCEPEYPTCNTSCQSRKIKVLIEKYKILPHWGGLCKHYDSNTKTGQKCFNFVLEEEGEESVTLILNTKYENYKVCICRSLSKSVFRSLTPIYRMWELLCIQLILPPYKWEASKTSVWIIRWVWVNLEQTEMYFFVPVLQNINFSILIDTDFNVGT